MRKVLVSFEDRLLKRIDAAARERGLSRSGFLSQLAARELDARTASERRRIESARRRLAELGARFGTPGDDSTAAVRRMRDERARRLSR